MPRPLPRLFRRLRSQSSLQDGNEHFTHQVLYLVWGKSCEEYEVFSYLILLDRLVWSNAWYLVWTLTLETDTGELEKFSSVSNLCLPGQHSLSLPASKVRAVITREVNTEQSLVLISRPGFFLLLPTGNNGTSIQSNQIIIIDHYFKETMVLKRLLRKCLSQKYL